MEKLSSRLGDLRSKTYHWWFSTGKYKSRLDTSENWVPSWVLSHDSLEVQLHSQCSICAKFHKPKHLWLTCVLCIWKTARIHQIQTRLAMRNTCSIVRLQSLFVRDYNMKLNAAETIHWFASTSALCSIKVALSHLLLTSVNVEYSVSFKSPRIVYHLLKHPSDGLNVVHRVHHYSCSTGDL